MSISTQLMEEGGGILRLSPAWVPRSFCRPGRRIKLQAYDHGILDESSEKIVQIARQTGANISGPIPLPTQKEIITILRAPHKYKDSREQFEIKTHKRLIDILEATSKTTDALMRLDLPSGVDIEIKL